MVTRVSSPPQLYWRLNNRTSLSYSGICNPATTPDIHIQTAPQTPPHPPPPRPKTGPPHTKTSENSSKGLLPSDQLAPGITKHHMTKQSERQPNKKQHKQKGPPGTAVNITRIPCTDPSIHRQKTPEPRKKYRYPACPTQPILKNSYRLNPEPYEPSPTQPNPAQPNPLPASFHKQMENGNARPNSSGHK